MMLLKALLYPLVLLFSIVGSAVAQDCDPKKKATAPASRFQALDNGVIKDTQYGHVWLRCVVGMEWDGKTCVGQSLAYTWQEALGVIGDMNQKRVGGRDDWRLPTAEELNTIVERQCFQPAINLEAFPFSPETGFWTDTKVPGIQQSRVSLIQFFNGKQYIANVKQSWRVRLVAGK